MYLYVYVWTAFSWQLIRVGLNWYILDLGDSRSDIPLVSPSPWPHLITSAWVGSTDQELQHRPGGWNCRDTLGHQRWCGPFTEDGKKKSRSCWYKHRVHYDHNNNNSHIQVIQMCLTSNVLMISVAMIMDGFVLSQGHAAAFPPVWLSGWFSNIRSY